MLINFVNYFSFYGIFCKQRTFHYTGSSITKHSILIFVLLSKELKFGKRKKLINVYLHKN